MSEEPRTASDEPSQERRDFLKKAGTAAATAPAVALLLAAHGRQAAAGEVVDDVVDVYGGPPTSVL